MEKIREDLEEGITVVGPERWFSVHIYDETGTRNVLLEVVPFVVQQLHLDESIDSFFFVRYRDERGPHVRLRLRLRAAEPHVCLKKILAIAGERFSVVCSPYELEVERYGGYDALPYSLSFFAVSSAHALIFEREFGHLSHSRQMTLALCFLLWQAWGFASNESEFIRLLSYYELGSSTHPEMVTLAEETLRRNGRNLTELVEQELLRLIALADETEEQVDLASASPLVTAAHALSVAVRELEPEARWSVGASQMHMTANRLGLTNPQETYTSQILCQVISEIPTSNPALWRQVVGALEQPVKAIESPMAGAANLRHSVQSHLTALLPQPA